MIFLLNPTLDYLAIVANISEKVLCYLLLPLVLYAALYLDKELFGTDEMGESVYDSD